MVPALAAGCCIILKPSELAPLSCLLLADMCTHAGECVRNQLKGKEGEERRGEEKRRGGERRFTLEKCGNIVKIVDIIHRENDQKFHQIDIGLSMNDRSTSRGI